MPDEEHERVEATRAESPDRPSLRARQHRSEPEAIVGAQLQSPLAGRASPADEPESELDPDSSELEGRPKCDRESS